MGTVNSFPTCYAFLSWPPMPCPTTDQSPFCLSPGNLSCLEEKKRKQTHVQSAMMKIALSFIGLSPVPLRSNFSMQVESHSRFSNPQIDSFLCPKSGLNRVNSIFRKGQIEMRAQNHPHFRHQDPPSSLTPLENATIFVVAFCPFPHPSGAISNAGRTEVKWVQSSKIRFRRKKTVWFIQA